jgi:(p)ppGpp synthase/HD superfamily hydrolase
MDIKATGTLKIYPNLFTQNAKQYAIKAHSDCNQDYDEYLPYEFHLRMVIRNAEKFLHLIPDEHKDHVIAGCWCHDLIEDTRENYNAVKKHTSEMAAEIVRACTNLTRGRNREERMPDWIYEDIKTTPYATFTKLCDRIANGQYSKMTGSSMYEKYQKEHAHFKKMLYTPGYLEEMWSYLEEIFGINK